MKKVAINGFGRIGRAFFRLAHGCSDLEVVAINDLMDSSSGAYLLQYDSAYGKYPEKISADEDELRVGSQKVAWLSVKNPSELPWRAMDIAAVIESTGVFASYEKAYTHIIAGADHVIVTAPVTGDAPVNVEADTVLVGVNTNRAGQCTVTSNASCTTNAVGIPLALLDKEIGVESAILNTVHSYTSSQQAVDGVSRKKGDLRLGRAAGANIIPSSTGAAVATTKAVASLRGRFDGISLRIPTLVGSLADVTFVAKRSTTVREVNQVLSDGADGLFTTTEEPLVSSDIVGEPYVFYCRPCTDTRCQ